MVVHDKLQDHLAYPPRGMRVERAAAYVGMSKTTFLEEVEAGAMPAPKRRRGMSIWDRLELDAAFEDWDRDAAVLQATDARHLLKEHDHAQGRKRQAT